jgi:hypothetical protein
MTTTTHAPQRIRRSRQRGYQMPEGAVYVGRTGGGGRWGNPYKVGVTYERHGSEFTITDKRQAVELYRAWLRRRPDLVAAIRAELSGRTLACWCALPAPGEPDYCHATVMLQVAQGGEPRPSANARHGSVGSAARL